MTERFAARLRARALTTCLAVAAWCIPQGCVTPSGAGRVGAEAAATHSLVWPPPPAAARIRYAGQISGEKDFGTRRSFVSRAATFIVGLREEDNAFVRPMAAVADGKGNLCVADPGAAAVFVYDRGRATLRCYRRFGDTHLLSPVAVAVSDSPNMLLVADSALGQVFAFTVSGRLLFKLSENLERPSGLAVSTDRIFVSDSTKNQIAVFDLNGREIDRFGTRGNKAGQFNCPTYLATDGSGFLYVTDTMNFRVQVFDRDNRFVRFIGRQGDTSGRFSRPKGVAMDAFGHIYVTDGLFDNVQMFDATGRFLLNWGEAGSEPGEFWLPAGISVSGSNTIYVADSFNHRVQVFEYVGGE